MRGCIGDLTEILHEENAGTPQILRLTEARGLLTVRLANLRQFRGAAEARQAGADRKSAGISGFHGPREFAPLASDVAHGLHSTEPSVGQKKEAHEPQTSFDANQKREKQS
jgi:hypothetical protein